jgi:AAA domain
MISNPFRISIVADPWNQLESNVPEIHAGAFDRCCSAVENVRQRSRTTSILIHGAVGTGKTHLLGRLRSHLAVRANAGETGAPHEAVFVAVRMQIGPDMLWRHLQRQLAVDLLRKTDRGETQLAHLFLRRLEGIGLVGSTLHRWLSGETSAARGFDDLVREMDSAFDRLDPNEDVSRDLHAALQHVLLGGRRRDAAAWLRGEPLPESALNALGIVEAEDREEQAEKIVIGLCALSGAAMPVVFCFDQIEALQVHPDDRDSLLAFGQMVSALHAKTHNALIISCIQTSLLDLLVSSVRDADRDRLSESGKVALNPLNWDEASRLIVARLNSHPELAAPRASQSDPLWPLRAGDIQQEIPVGGISARKLLFKCAELFDAAQLVEIGPKPEPVSTGEYLEQDVQRRLARAIGRNKPGQPEQDLAHDLSLLLHLNGHTVARRSAGAPPEVDLVISQGGERIAVSFCNHNTKSLWRRLDKLAAWREGARPDRLVLVRDARLAIGQQAKATHQRRESLLAGGARWVTLSGEAAAMLDALREVGRSGEGRRNAGARDRRTMARRQPARDAAAASFVVGRHSGIGCRRPRPRPRIERTVGRVVAEASSDVG